MNEKDRKAEPLFSQRRWRIVGILMIMAAGAMAWFGVQLTGLRESPMLFLGYWALFTVLLLGSVYIAFLDIRFVRMQYTIGQRDLVKQTIDKVKQDKALRDAAEPEKAAAEKPPFHRLN